MPTPEPMTDHPTDASPAGRRGGRAARGRRRHARGARARARAGQRAPGPRGAGGPAHRARAARERDAPAGPRAHHGRLALGGRRERPLHGLLRPGDGRARLHPGRDHRAHALRPHGGGGRRRRRPGVRAHGPRARGLLGAEEPQPPQGRARGGAAHELRADAERRRAAARLPRRRQGHHPAGPDGALPPPRRRGSSRRCWRPAARWPPASTTTRCCGAWREPPARRWGPPSASSGSTRRTPARPSSAASGSASPAPGVAESLVGETYPIRTHAGGMDALRAGVVIQQSRSDPDLPPDDAADMDALGREDVAHRAARDGREAPRRDDPHRVRGASADFDADEVRMAGVIGEQAAMAMRNALRHRREEERNRWLRSLVSAGPRGLRRPRPGRRARGGRAPRGRGHAVAGRVHLRVRARPRRARHAGALGVRRRAAATTRSGRRSRSRTRRRTAGRWRRGGVRGERSPTRRCPPRCAS